MNRTTIAAIFADQDKLGGKTGHRLRLGPDHPGHEDLRLYRTE